MHSYSAGGACPLICKGFSRWECPKQLYESDRLKVLDQRFQIDCLRLTATGKPMAAELLLVSKIAHAAQSTS